MKTMKKVMLTLLILVAVGAMAALGMWWWATTTNPSNYSTVGEIPAPSGFTRVEAPEGSFAAYTRSLPLKERGSKVQLYTGGDARLQFLAAAVIDLPLLSNDEQCADAAMRLRAEHLWQQGRYGEIAFRNVGGKRMQYGGGRSRKAFESFMRRVYGVCSTYSMYTSDTEPQAVADVKPGDVFVFPAVNGKLGHACLVADVATASDGRKAVMLVEGNTPARDIHVVRNPNLLRNPWFILDPDDPGSTLVEKGFAMKGGGLRKYK